MMKAVEAIFKPNGGPAAHRAAGVKLGRKKGSGKSRLEPYKEEIVASLRNGSPKNFVAKPYQVCEPKLTISSRNTRWTWRLDWSGNENRSWLHPSKFVVPGQP
jgi:hypothetical protein